MSKKPTNLKDALARIDELEKEISQLKERIEYFESKEPAGRKKHDAKWQKSYKEFVDLYVAGESMSTIVEVSNFSRRTAYRYKAYYDSLVQSSNNSNNKKSKE